MDIRTAGLAASLIGLLGVVTRILWGVVSERRRHFSGPLALLSLLSALAVISLLAGATTGQAAFWVGVTLAGVSVAAWNSVANLAATHDDDTSAVGRASGLVVGGFLAWFAVSPVLFGLSVDVTGGYTVGWSATVVAFCLALLLAVIWGWQSRRQRGRRSRPGPENSTQRPNAPTSANDRP
jgi:MFS family permease